jgi:3-oxoadipate CoA-transferase alpha subunit
MIGGFGNAGMPSLIDALIAQGAKTSPSSTTTPATATAWPRCSRPSACARSLLVPAPGRLPSFRRAVPRRRNRTGTVPQGNLAERIRAAGAGIGGFFTPTGYGTLLAEGKETRLIDGRHYVLESPIHADFALIKALKGDRWGNLVYRKTARNFGPIMAMAAKVTIAQVQDVVALGELDPEVIVTPGIFVQRVVKESA